MIILFFLFYAFPLFFVAIPSPEVSPQLANILFGAGIVMWSALTWKIFDLAYLNPQRKTEKIRQIQHTGAPVRAHIVNKESYGSTRNLVRSKLTLRFRNFAGTDIEGDLLVTDSRPAERRFETGKMINLQLNRESMVPPYVTDDDVARTNNLSGLIAVLFNIAYAVGLFAFTHYLKSDGSAWGFLSPSDPWVWAPIMFGIEIAFLSFMARIASPFTGGRVGTARSAEDSGELLLYGVSTPGQVVNYNRSGSDTNDDPYVDFYIRTTINGQVQELKHTQVVPISEVHTLQRGPVEVIYLPHRPDLYTAQFPRS
ncbi:MAG: hypothetical protein GX483_06250 [Actinomycetaceae bacterium]|nr:hypothetical protein [Actinomycetaceae bacterium]